MKISNTFRKSIQERCYENESGRIIVPTDILNKFIKETNQENELRGLVRGQIIDIARGDK